MNKWIVGFAAALALLITACGGANQSATPVRETHPPKRTSTTVVRPRVKRPVPLYSFDFSVPPPRLVQTGNDYKRIIESILEYADWIAAHHPSREAVANLTSFGSESQHYGDQFVVGEVRDGQRYYERHGAPNTIEVQQSSRDWVTARVTQDIRDEITVVKDGRVIGSKHPGLTTYRVILVNEDGRWVFASIVDQND